jgi:coenzyme F420 hydrogenase subunit beta
MLDRVTKTRNVNMKQEKRFCTGCGTCSGICPSQAISMEIDRGIYKPVVSADKCVNCGLCAEVCPSLGIDIPRFSSDLFECESFDPRTGFFREAYTGYSTNQEIRLGAASGGMVSGLLIHALEQGIVDGALVTRMSERNPLIPETILARTKEEILLSRKSLYCPAAIGSSYRLLLKEGKYAVVGLPCHIHGLRKAQTVLPQLAKNVILVLGLFCSNVRTFNATKNILAARGIDHSRVRSLSYRADRWGAEMSVKAEDNQDHTIKGYYETKEFGSFINFRCTLCWDHTNELADISLGDAWHQYSPEIPGKSVILLRAKNASEVLVDAVSAGKIKIEQSSVADLVESQHGLHYKKERIGARYALVRLIYWRCPSFCQTFPKPTIAQYLNEFRFYLFNFLIFRYGITRKAFDICKRIVGKR